jgi:hypothetical protein
MRKYEYDTVRACLYWKNIDLAREYQKFGIEVVTAGHAFDPLFLPRLRSLIELSDLTVSNCVGTHLGYSVSLGKPHLLVNQDIERVDSKNEYYKGFVEDYLKEIEKLNSAFGKYSESVTIDQRKILSYYAGFEHLKTPEEMNKILQGEADGTP